MVAACEDQRYPPFSCRCVFAVVVDWYMVSIVFAVCSIAVIALRAVIGLSNSSFFKCSISDKICMFFFTACLSPVLFHENPKPEKRRGKDGQGRKRRSGEETAVRGGIKPRGGNNG